ncbi:Brix-domain-containing protein, partial [Coccomyxa subellipsoidea C-169]
QRKKRTHIPNFTDPAKKSEPKTFVFWRGKQGLILKALETDLRRVMQPNTAEHLKESRKNQLRDFVDIAGPLGVSHFLILTATDNAAYLRVAKTPRGPTLTMRIHAYSLMRDVTATLQRPRQPASMWKSPPLVVMNNFGGQEELKLATALFQNLFPAINVQTANLSSCQRVVLLSYDKETRRISFRHYGISAAPSGVTKSVKSLVARRQLPDMGSLQDVSEFLTKSGYGSESEGEEAAEARVELAQDMGRGNMASRQSRVRLQEIGPRMELEVVKVEEGMCTGRVLYHSYVHRSAAEAAVQQQEIDEREKLRADRRRQQVTHPHITMTWRCAVIWLMGTCWRQHAQTCQVGTFETSTSASPFTSQCNVRSHLGSFVHGKVAEGLQNILGICVGL